MKLYIIFLFLVMSLSSCRGALGILRQQTVNEYASIPNRIGDTLIRDENAENDSIYFEEIKYHLEDHNYFIVLGNIMGGKSSLLLAIQKKPLKILYKNECAYCDSCIIKKIKGFNFLIVNRHYRDMCSEENSYSVYMIKNGLYECFDDFSRVRYYEGEPCLPIFDSYDQTFRLSIKDGDIVLFADKTEGNGRMMSYVYKLTIKH